VGTCEFRSALVRETDDVAAAIVPATFTGQEAFLFERVEERDDHARVEAHQRRELPLLKVAPVVQEREQLVLARCDAALVVRRAQSMHGVVAEQCQQKARACAALIEQPRRGCGRLATTRTWIIIGGFTRAITSRPGVTLVYYGGQDGPGPMFLSIRGHARVDESIADTVWSAMIDGERQQDPDRRGVPIVIDVISVSPARRRRVTRRAPARGASTRAPGARSATPPGRLPVPS
jgi:hypothetical protein